MNQEVNLLKRQRIRTRSPLKVARLFLLSAVLVLSAATLKAAVSFYQLHALESEYEQVQSDYTEAKTKLNGLQALADKANDPKALQEFLELEERLDSLQRTRDVLKRDMFSNTSGYSAFFTTFAENAVRGLWLTNIGIVGAGEQITLEGRCTDPSLLPKYIKRLAESETIDGTRFNGLRITRPEKGQAEHRYDYVDFVMTTDIDSLAEL